MPGSSAPSGLGTMTRTSAVRVAASSAVATAATAPVAPIAEGRDLDARGRSERDLGQDATR
jgi:hypothetical protein